MPEPVGLETSTPPDRRSPPGRTGRAINLLIVGVTIPENPAPGRQLGKSISRMDFESEDYRRYVQGLRGLWEFLETTPIEMSAQGFCGDPVSPHPAFEP